MQIIQIYLKDQDRSSYEVDGSENTGSSSENDRSVSFHNSVTLEPLLSLVHYFLRNVFKFTCIYVLLYSKW